MNNNTDNHITIDELAGMVKRGFDGVDERLDLVNDKLDRIEKLILAEHKLRIEKLEQDVKTLKELFAL